MTATRPATGNLEGPDVIGLEAIGPDGQRIGSVEGVHTPTMAGAPRFARVDTGMFGMRPAFVPLRCASLRDDGLHVRYTRDMVRRAPTIDGDEPTPTQERALGRFYGLEPTVQSSDQVWSTPSSRVQ